jgi:hypothetical protein
MMTNMVHTDAVAAAGILRAALNNPDSLPAPPSGAQGSMFWLSLKKLVGS